MLNTWTYDEQKTRLGDPFIADQYHFRQARTIWAERLHEINAVHDYFIRKTPFGSYLLVSGTERVLKNMYNFRFSEEDIERVAQVDPLSGKREYEDYLEYLRKLRFKANVWINPEGGLAFANEPIIRIDGNWLETWMIESMILKSMNYASLVATYASKVVMASRGRPVADFGLRRSPGDGAGITSTRASFIGGMKSTSNVRAAINLEIPVKGTMSHEFVQTFTAITGSEVNAFAIYGKHNPDNFILLIDTFNTIQGAKNAIKAAETFGIPAEAVRLDSGNLADLSKEVRKLDIAGKKFRKIVISSDLTYELVNQLIKANAPFDMSGVGTKNTAPSNPSALGGVYKLAAIEINGELVPVIKISEDAIKVLLPGKKDVWRQIDGGNFTGDIINLSQEGNPGSDYESVLIQAIKGGKTRRKMLIKPQKLTEIQKFAASNLEKLPVEYRRIENPLPYPTTISNELQNLKDQLILEAKTKNDSGVK